MKKWYVFWLCIVAVSSMWAQSIPFRAELKMVDDVMTPRIVLEITVPDNHKLYADSFAVTDSEGNPLRAIKVPEPEQVYDVFTELDTPVFKHSFVAEYERANTEAVNVTLFGCSDVACFPPTTLTLALSNVLPPFVESVVDSSSAPDWQALADQFDVVASSSGFMDVPAFHEFLDVQKPKATGFLTAPISFFKQFGWPLTALLILGGGLLLNLTPCVLPMIPVNVAIIGAGAQAGSKRKGFMLGGVYGLGIALTYGLLGLVVVLTGSKFGTLNASPWFNIVIAMIFVLLGLGMFDVIMIDLSRFQNKIGTGGKKGGYAVALTMGAVVALLAGACVAPVVIAVLLLSSNLYASGAVMGLLLPFVLGVGMALPWPFVGAGLSFLPKPGNWMNTVKKVFGVLICAMALYYGHLSYTLFRSNPAQHLQLGEPHGLSLEQGLQKALDEDRLVVIDFWATWCKNCMVMKKTTLNDSTVKEAMSDVVFIPFQAEDQTDPETKAAMDYFDALGLPTFVILKPKD